MGKGYRDLEVWQLSMQLAVEIYEVTQLIPDSERFGLISQMRRAAISVPTNVAEGHGRELGKSFANFLRTSQGSLNELETLLELCDRLEYIDKARITELFASCKRLAVKLENLKSYLIREDVSEYDATGEHEFATHPADKILKTT